MAPVVAIMLPVINAMLPFIVQTLRRRQFAYSGCRAAITVETVVSRDAS
jgi:hypothetical protein